MTSVEPGLELWSPLFHRKKNCDVRVFKCVDEERTTKVIVSFGASLRQRYGCGAESLRVSWNQIKSGPTSYGEKEIHRPHCPRAWLTREAQHQLTVHKCCSAK